MVKDRAQLDMIQIDKAQLNTVCENFIKHVMDFYDIPGIAVGVYVGCQASSIGAVEKEFVGTDSSAAEFIGTGGFRNYETKQPVEPDTVFHCTSVSKLFTAAGVMKLVEEGELALSDKLCDVLTWLSIADKRWNNITIEHMLCHTSGLTDVSDYGWERHEIDEDSLRRYALSPEVAERKLLWDPSEGKFRYSSLAYNLLGLVIAEVSGVSFEDFIAKELFKPLGMTNTTFKTYDRTNGKLNLEGIAETGLAMPHRKAKDRSIILEENFPYTRQHAPSSTLTSTAGDLLKWAQWCIKAKDPAELQRTRDVTEPQSAPLHKDSMQAMWQTQVEVPDTGEMMGLGWFIRETVIADGKANGKADGKTYTLMGHEGSDDGFRTSFWVCPEAGIATVLLSNLTDAPLKKLSKRFFEQLINIGRLPTRG